MADTITITLPRFISTDHETKPSKKNPHGEYPAVKGTLRIDCDGITSEAVVASLLSDMKISRQRPRNKMSRDELRAHMNTTVHWSQVGKTAPVTPEAKRAAFKAYLATLSPEERAKELEDLKG